MYSYPYGYPIYGYQSNNNENSNWIWIIVVIFVTQSLIFGKSNSYMASISSCNRTLKLNDIRRASTLSYSFKLILLKNSR